MKKNFYYFLGFVKSFFSYFDRFIFNSFSLLSIIAMFLCTIVLITFTITQITTSMGTTVIFKDTTDWILTLLGFDIDNLTNNKYVSILGMISSVVAVLVTLWFSVITTIKYFRQKHELRKKSLIKKEYIHEDGKDDLEVMYNYYKKADEVIVFSGDFSWLDKHEKLKEIILLLVYERKITFVSYKSEEFVERSISNIKLYEEIKCRFKFDSDLKIKCSLVKANQGIVFLSKVDNTIEGGDKNIFVISGRNDGRDLLNTISAFCNPFVHE